MNTTDPFSIGGSASLAHAVEYPAAIEVPAPDPMSRWRPLVQWILAIPHLVIAATLWEVQAAIALASWLMILIRGRLPSGLADFQAMIIRYRTRITLYSGFVHAQYPPFEYAMSAAEPGGSPVRISLTPALEDRNRLTVALRLVWMIPALLYAAVVALAGVVCWIVAFFAVIVTGRWPAPLWRWVVRSQRVLIRVSAYALLLTDTYPPFRTD
jgi:hypothetical protein